MRVRSRRVVIEGRTTLIVALVVTLLTAPLVSEGQQAGKPWRIGYLGGSPSATRRFIEAFQQGLRELGYVDGGPERHLRIPV